MGDPTQAFDLCRAADAAEATAFADLYAAAPANVAAAAGLRVDSVAGAKLLIAPGLPTPLFNRVIGLGTFEPADAAALDAISQTYQRAGVGKFWISVSPVAKPVSLASQLRGLGFQPANRPLWAQMRWGDAPPPAIATTLTINRAQPHEADELARAVATAFDMPPPIVGWLAALVEREGWGAFAARSGGRIVGGGFVYTRPPLAWLGMGSILPDFRGDNGQLALFAARITHAQAKRCASIHTETGEPVGGEPNPSLTNMIRFGFEKVASRPNFAK